MSEEQKKSRSAQKKRQTARRSYLLKDYFIDCSKPDMLYAALVRSPVSGGKITNVDFSDLPEGYYFFSARDIPGENYITTEGIKTRVFCNEKVHYKGQPVGIIAGPSLEKARELAKDIQITFDITTVKSELQEAVKDFSQVQADFAGNAQTAATSEPTEQQTSPEAQQVQNDSSIADFVDMINILPDLDELPKESRRSSYTEPSQIEESVRNIHPGTHTQRIFAERTVKSGFFKITDDVQIIEDEMKLCPHDISSSWTLDETTPDWTEPNGVLCYRDGAKLNVLTTTQWPSYLAANVSRVLNIPEEKIIVQKTLSQTENTSGIWRNTTLAAQTALAANITGKPVKLVLSKEEQQTFLQTGIKTNISLRTAVEADGAIKALIAEIDCDAGYSNPFAQEIADRLAIAVCNFYNARHVSIHVTVHSSENPPSSIYAESIDSQAFFAIENHLQLIASRTDILPQELRLKNICLIEREIKSPFKFSFSRPVETLNAIITQSDFPRKNAAFRIDAEKNLKNGRTFFSLSRRGIGLATAYDGACFYGTSFPLSEQKIEVVFTEEKKLIINAICPSNSVIAIWKKIAADTLDIELSQIVLNTEYAATQETFMPESFCNDISITALLLKRACETIKRRIEKEPLPITVEKTLTTAMKKQWNKTTFSGKPYQTSAFGAAIVEVELNADTYQEKINGIWIAIDCGEIYSLKAAEHSVRLALQQELEHLIKDTKLESDAVHISFAASNQMPCQIGKLIHNIIPAAFSSALSMALSKPVMHLPCTKQELFELTLPTPVAQEQPDSSKKDEVASAATAQKDSSDLSDSADLPSSEEGSNLPDSALAAEKAIVEPSKTEASL